jgi:hypothetical protein
MQLNKERRLIVTRSFKITEISEISHPLIAAYASRCDADFKVIDRPLINIGPFHNEIFQCHDLLDEYDRILCIDSDVLISSDTPNIFERVPYDTIGTVFEDIANRKYHRRMFIKAIQKKFGDVKWEKGYINTGFIIFSKCHQLAFKINDDEFWNDLGFDDVQLGYMFHKFGFKIENLGRKFNHMSMFSELGYSWLDSYIIHYAGTGFYRRMDRSRQMKIDLQFLSEEMSLKHRFFVAFARLRLLAIGCFNFLSDLKYYKKEFRSQ